MFYIMKSKCKLLRRASHFDSSNLAHVHYISGISLANIVSSAQGLSSCFIMLAKGVSGHLWINSILFGALRTEITHHMLDVLNEPSVLVNISSLSLLDIR